MKITKRMQIAAALALTMTGPAAAVEAGQQRLAFEVLLDDKPIGSHSFIIRDEGPSRIVETRASFDVNVLFVPVFKYRHTNTETWQNGCLEQISSTTDSNGKDYRVAVAKNASGYEIRTNRGESSLGTECMMSFAYWDRRFLEQDRLINTQTGEVIPVQVKPLGKISLQLADREIVAEGYRVLAEAEDVDIRVYYDDTTGRWVSLESVLEGGRKMRYVPAMGLLASSADDLDRTGGAQ